MVHHLNRVENIEFTITQAKYFTIHQGNPPPGTTTSKLIVTKTQDTLLPQVQFDSKETLSQTTHHKQCEQNMATPT